MAKHLSDEIVLRGCQLFLEREAGKRSIRSIAEKLRDETGLTFNREAVYRMFEEAHRRGFLALIPPTDHTLESRLVSTFDLPGLSHRIRVVSATKESAVEAVCSFAALDAVQQIKDIARQIGSDRVVGVGLVGGRTLKRTSELLARHLRFAADLPPLSIHAICSGFDPRTPQTAPVSFLSHFEDIPAVQETVALFAPPAVWVSGAKTYESVFQDPIVRSAKDRSGDINVVITSLASFADEHNTLHNLADVTERDISDYYGLGIVADVAYQPYGVNGPIKITSGPRAVTLFEIEDLVELARTKDGRVLLLGSPCSACPDSDKAEALYPLLRRKDLRVWNHLYLDPRTAEHLLSMAKRDGLTVPS